jgi:hypothetical protein
MPERRSRRRPLLFIHGELTGSWIWERYLSYFASRGWEGHALNLRNHFWSETTDIATVGFEDYVDDVVAVMDKLGHNAVAVGHGMGGCSPSRPPSDTRSGPWSCWTASCREICERPSGPLELREIPDVYGRDHIGWETLPEKLQRDNRDLTIADIVRLQHLFGQKPHESGLAKREILEGIGSTGLDSRVSRCSWWVRVWTAPRRRRARSDWPTGWAVCTSLSGLTPTTAW